MSFFFFSSRRRHTRLTCDWSSDVCSSDLAGAGKTARVAARQATGGAGIRGIAAGKWRACETIERLRGIAGRIQRPDYSRGHRGSAAGDVGQFSARYKLMSAVLDTHTALWSVFDRKRISQTALQAIRRSVNAGKPLLVSAISLVETIYHGRHPGGSGLTRKEVASGEQRQHLGPNQRRSRFLPCLRQAGSE